MHLYRACDLCFAQDLVGGMSEDAAGGMELDRAFYSMDKDHVRFNAHAPIVQIRYACERVKQACRHCHWADHRPNVVFCSSLGWKHRLRRVLQVVDARQEVGFLC